MPELTLDDAILAICRADGVKPDDTGPANFLVDVATQTTVPRIAAYRDHPEVQERARLLLIRFKEMEELELIRNAKMRRAMGRERY